MRRAFQMTLVVKNPPASAGDIRDMGRIPGLGRSPGEGQGNVSHILAWRIPQTEEPGKLQSMGLQRVRHDYAILSHFSHVQLCANPQTAAHQASPSLGFSRQEHWNGLPFPSPLQTFRNCFNTYSDFELSQMLEKKYI